MSGLRGWLRELLCARDRHMVPGLSTILLTKRLVRVPRAVRVRLQTAAWYLVRPGRGGRMSARAGRQAD
nr:MAG TPA: hypothetical protein [Caudoviricetes sp.]